MAHTINVVIPGIAHKEGHKCFEGNSFLGRFLAFSNFCPICGEDLRVKRLIRTRKCSECDEGLPLPKFDYHYCPNCGVKFDKVRE